MDNQSRSSFQQGLFKQRECEKERGKKKKNPPEPITFILQRGTQTAASLASRVPRQHLSLSLPCTLHFTQCLGEPSFGPGRSLLPFIELLP